MSIEKDNHGLDQANAQMESVRAMVAALEVDYDRLEELRDERDELQTAIVDAEKEMDEAATRPGIFADNDAINAVASARVDLDEWLADNADELAELVEQAGDCVSIDDAETAIDQDALSVEVRSDWRAPGDEGEDAEFKILLCTGGPHVEIRGGLDNGTPSRAWLEYADWGTGLTERVNDEGDQDALLAYASRFFG